MNKKLRYAAAAAVLAVLIMIWPAGIIHGSGLEPDGRLRYDLRAGSWFFIGPGEYVTNVWHGGDKFLDHIAFRVSCVSGDVPEGAQLRCTLYDDQAQLLLQEIVTLTQTSGYETCTVPAGLTLEKGTDYQFLIESLSDGEIGIVCKAGTSEPMLTWHFDPGDGAEAAGSVLVWFLRGAAWALGILLITALTCGRDMARTAVIVLVSAVLLIITMQYLLDQVTESRKAVYMGCVLASGMVVLAWMEARRVKRNLIALLILAFAGVTLIAALPAGMAPDETQHFFRAFEISCGGIFAKRVGPEGIPGDIFPAAVQRYSDPAAILDWNDCEEAVFANTALYSPVCYLPQVIGIKIARALTGSARTIFYSGKVAGFATALVIELAALRIMPYAKELLFVVMASPMAVQEMSALSSDSLTNALVFFYLAYMLHLVYGSGERRITWRQFFIAFAAGTLAGMCKTVYIVVVLLVLLLGNERFGTGKGGKYKAICAKFLLMAGPAAISVYMTSLYNGYLIRFDPTYDSSAQIAYALRNPFSMVLTAIRTTVLKSEGWLGSMTSDYLGGLDIRTAQVVPIMYLVLLVCLMMNTAAPKKRNGFREAAVFAAITVLGYTLICASMYATWTAVGDTLILGIQGRYFLAILPFLLLWVVAGRTRRGTAPAGKDLDGMIWSAAEEYGYIAEMILMAVNAFAVIDIYRFLIISG